MMAGKLQTTVRIGGKIVGSHSEYPRGPNAVFGVSKNNAIYARATPSRIGKIISDQLVAYAVDNSHAARDIENEIKVLKNAIEHAGNVEARRIMDFINSKLVGRGEARFGADYFDTQLAEGMKKPKGGWKPAFPVGGEVNWEPLSLGWMNHKRKTGTQNRYFQHTGDLRRTMRGMRASYPASLGGVEVTARTRGKRAQQNLRRSAQDGQRRRVAFGELEIKIFPRVPANLFPGLLNGHWDTWDHQARLEASSFVPANIREKLAGPRQGGYAYRFRPMLGPVTQFWILHRIPAAIATAIANGTRTRSQEGYQRPSRDALGMPIARR